MYLITISGGIPLILEHLNTLGALKLKEIYFSSGFVFIFVFVFIFFPSPPSPILNDNTRLIRITEVIHLFHFGRQL